MPDIYDACPIFEDERYRIRLIAEDDAEDLHKVYSDKNALPFFNSDNCHGDNFYNPTVKGMAEAIKGWLYAYSIKDFVRLSIVDKAASKVIGTIELFHRSADDAFDNTGVLRIDLGSSYENKEIILNILNLIVEPAFELFECNTVITKAPIYAVERIDALTKYGFEKSGDYLIGHLDNYPYRDYWTISKNT